MTFIAPYNIFFVIFVVYEYFSFRTTLVTFKIIVRHGWLLIFLVCLTYEGEPVVLS